MAVLTVGQGEQFSTIAAAVGAASPGDTIDVQAGTYNDQFLTIEQSLTLQAVGGEVVMTEDTEPPDGKAMITEGQPGLSSRSTASTSPASRWMTAMARRSATRAATCRSPMTTSTTIRTAFSQRPIRTAPSPSITPSSPSTATARAIPTTSMSTTSPASPSPTATFHDADVGHEIKSRAENTMIENNRIFDNKAPASYDIDLPDGGNATITRQPDRAGPEHAEPVHDHLRRRRRPAAPRPTPAPM